MALFHQGTKKQILLTANGASTLTEAESNVPKSKQACKAQLRRLMQWLGDHGSLKSPVQLRNEGDGIYAVRARCGLRAYGWFDTDTAGKPSFIVGHVILKKKQKADAGDLDKAKDERAKYQERKK